MRDPEQNAALVPAWPRLSELDRETGLQQLISSSVTEAGAMVSTSTAGAVFYPTAPQQVEEARLIALRVAIVDLATEHGFPGAPAKRREPTFDQQLAQLAADKMPMLPVEAADPEVWEFLTTRIVPDVAVWRWPDSGGGNDAEQDADPRASRVDRLRGGRRGMLRQAWWRSYLLGRENCLKLDEDNFVQLTDRISLTGDRRLAEAIVATHLRMKERDRYHPRNGLRAALVLIGRAHGRIAVDALNDEEVRSLVAEAFEATIGER